ncbi:sensor histidine kinase [Gaoshiqia sp. Z1-71]|uniref:sensor histidine kinase n=1 Tax=Gaoshiqia hydrogeniformans TaxID=3290090 RepID=UPI003BF7909C
MEILKKYLLLMISAGLFILGFIAENRFMNRDQEKLVARRFQEVLHKQQELLDRKLDEIIEKMESDEFDGYFQSNFNDLLPLFRENGLGFLITDNQNLLYWSNNQFSFAGRFMRQFREEQIQFLPNGVFLSATKTTGPYSVIGLIHLKDHYSIQNKYIENKFNVVFNTPDSYFIQLKRSTNAYPIFDLNGDYLLSLAPYGNVQCEPSKLYLPAGIFLLALLVLFFFSRQLFKRFSHEHFILRVFILGLSLFGFYWFHLLFRIPAVCYAFELFSPSLYAYSLWLPSIGDLLLLAVLIFFWSYNFSKDFVFSKKRKNYELMIGFGFTALFYVFINFLIRNLILNSSFSFQLNRIDNINPYSLVGYSIIALLFFSAFIINIKLVEASGIHLNRKKFLWVSGILTLLFLMLSATFKSAVIYIICLFLITSFSVFVFQNTQLKRVSLSFLIYFVSLFTFFSLVIIQSHNNERRRQIQRLQAITLYSEHDPAAEIFLTEMQQQMNVDSTVVPYLLSSSYENLEDYFEQHYFNGYFRKYDSQITICDGSDSLLIQPENRMVPCFPFFDKMIEELGTPIPGTKFYYMNNMDGRISYFGKIFYPLSSDSLGISVFIELRSKLLPEGIGFPELLLDKSMEKPDRYRQFSYAKYFNNELVYLSGDYQYNYYISSYDIANSTSEFSLRKWDGYEHLTYKLGNSNYIVVSAKAFEFLDYLISFPYLFVFYLVFVLVIVFIGNTKYRQQALVYDLKFRIQASIISVVLFSLMLVAAGTIYYNLHEYASRYQDDLNEKMSSIAEEINLRLNTVDDFSPEVRTWLWRELNNLSNIFRTDINIFGNDGELIASSRPEIFNRGIVSTRMDALAFYELTENYQISYIQPEKIGRLSFLSIYEPIINNKGEYLGFINLPYFTRGDEMKQEVTTFIVAFINLYVLLFFASVIVAVILANQITRPLSLIREKLKGIQLDKKNEQISYHRDDEIGALIKEYNRKVDELADSAELLARSEREMAWREMAKQIAHEIKNPLTPMKLNIQYLQRAKAEKSEHYDEYFDRVTRILIEQIDTLSDIATEFSNFAKIPKAKNEVFNLVKRLIHVTELFESNQQVNFRLELNGHEEVSIYADQEQISRVMVNLIKNAMQSIPPTRKGEITISLSTEKGQAVIAVKDNGDGIPEKIRQQMFQPNFTTKTSGMGLGLAIVKKIIETFRGRIWFETEIHNGSTFYVELPLHTEP